MHNPESQSLWNQSTPDDEATWPTPPEEGMDSFDKRHRNMEPINEQTLIDIFDWNLKETDSRQERLEKLTRYFGTLFDLMSRVAPIHAQENYQPLSGRAAEAGEEVGQETQLPVGGVEWQVDVNTPVLVISDVHGRVEFIEQLLSTQVKTPTGESDTVWSLLQAGKIKLAFVGDYHDTERLEDWMTYSDEKGWTPKTRVDQSLDTPILRSFQAMATVLALKAAFPDSIFLGQGNHDAAVYGRPVAKFGANQTGLTEKWVEENIQALPDSDDYVFTQFWRGWQDFVVTLPVMLKAGFVERDELAVHLSGVRSVSHLVVTHATLVESSAKVSGWNFMNNPTSLSFLGAAQGDSAPTLTEAFQFFTPTDLEELTESIIWLLQRVDVQGELSVFLDPEYEEYFWKPLREIIEKLSNGEVTQQDIEAELGELGDTWLNTSSTSESNYTLRLDRAKELLETYDTIKSSQHMVFLNNRTTVNEYSEGLYNWLHHKQFLRQIGIDPQAIQTGRSAWVTGHSQIVLSNPSAPLAFYRPAFAAQESGYTLLADTAEEKLYAQRGGEVQICNPNRWLVALVVNGKTQVYDLNPSPIVRARINGS